MYVLKKLNREKYVKTEKEKEDLLAQGYDLLEINAKPKDEQEAELNQETEVEKPSVRKK